MSCQHTVESFCSICDSKISTVDKIINRTFFTKTLCAPYKDTEIHHSSMTMLESIMLMAETWANARSKDPNTKVGAVIYDYSTGSMHFGYNGFPKGIDDLCSRWQRPTKYEYVIHAEENAILKALQGGAKIESSALFVTHKPCHKCMRLVAQVGLKQVYYKHPHDDSKITDIMASEAGISLMVVP